MYGCPPKARKCTVVHQKLENVRLSAKSQKMYGCPPKARKWKNRFFIRTMALQVFVYKPCQNLTHLRNSEELLKYLLLKAIMFAEIQNLLEYLIQKLGETPCIVRGIQKNNFLAYFSTYQPISLKHVSQFGPAVWPAIDNITAQ